MRVEGSRFRMQGTGWNVSSEDQVLTWSDGRPWRRMAASRCTNSKLDQGSRAGVYVGRGFHRFRPVALDPGTGHPVRCTRVKTREVQGTWSDGRPWRRMAASRCTNSISPAHCVGVCVREREREAREKRERYRETTGSTHPSPSTRPNTRSYWGM